MAYAALTLEIKDHIAHLVFNRPEAMNAMNRDMWREIPQAINAIDVDASARVIVISASGKHFTAGMDLSVFGKPGPYKDAEIGRRRAHLRTDIMRMQECFTAFERARMPVIAANRIGEEDGQRFYGHSFISDEWGDLIADGDAKDFGALVATLDLAQARTHRAGMGFFRDRRPQLYSRLAEDI